MEHRKFSRAEFVAPGRLEKLSLAGSDGAKSFPCQITEISLKGAKVITGGDVQIRKGEQVLLFIELEPGDLEIQMKSHIVYHDTDFTGLRFIETDLDSITHLRRLLELNTAESESIERELEFLKEE